MAELEFDKEMDALLRKARPADGPPAAVQGSHLDADEIAAVAENAMPAAARTVLTRHLADCGRCRSILAETITMAERADAAATVVAPAAESSAPWYRRIFLFPNLAYVMGGLVLVFSGLIGYLALQNAGDGSATVSQVTETEPAASAPSFGSESAPSAANAIANIAEPFERSINANTSVASRAANANVSQPAAAVPVDAVRSESAPSTATAAAPPAATVVIDGADAGAAQQAPVAAMEKEKDEDAKTLALEKNDYAARARAANEANRELRQAPAGALRAPAKKSGPSRDMQSQFPNVTQNQENTFLLRTAGGKQFAQRADGVWYDTEYRSQRLTSVRRGTEAFLRLDAGLRQIADSIGGTSVIVWKGRAYKIQ